MVGISVVPIIMIEAMSLGQCIVNFEWSSELKNVSGCSSIFIYIWFESILKGMELPSVLWECQKYSL